MFPGVGEKTKSAKGSSNRANRVAVVTAYFRGLKKGRPSRARWTNGRHLNGRVRLLVLLLLLEVRAAVHVFVARVYRILLAALRYLLIDDAGVLVILFVLVPGGDVRLASGADTARSFLVAPTPRCNKQRHDRSRQKCVCVCGFFVLFAECSFTFGDVLVISFLFDYLVWGAMSRSAPLAKLIGFWVSVDERRAHDALSF